MKLLSLIPKICQPSYTSKPGTAAQYQATIAVDSDYRGGSSLLRAIERFAKTSGITSC
ncbi:hypothetical protein ACLUWI_02680 [Limosilactobacillus mucosae]|uniref:hypothetical protein n=1 Tax=Limosilactobacillus mucosae TaxID=97478 RepID=UPI0039956B9B